MSSGIVGNIRGHTVLRVGKNALARLSAQTWARLLSVVLVALVARYEGATSLGRYVLVVTLVGIAGVASDLGLNTFLTREAAREMEDQRQRELLGLILPLKAGLTLIGVFGLILVATLAPFPEATKRLIPLGALTLFPEGLAGTIGALVNARQRMEVSAVINMVMRLATVALSLPVLALGYGVAGVLVCSLGASILGLFLSTAVIWRWRLSPRYTLNIQAWRKCLIESFPFALNSVIAAVYARLDLILLSLWQGELIAGWYGAAYKLWEAFGLLPASILDAMFPAMSLLSVNRDGLQKLRGLFHNSARAMVVGGFLLSAVGTWGAAVLIPLIYGGQADYEATIATFRLLVWAIPAMFLYLLGGHTLYVLGRQRRVTAAMLIVAPLSGMLNILVIPRWSYSGAAVVALCSEWLLCGLLYPGARRALAAAEMPIAREG